jgi:Rieske Fe-S protein
MSGPIRGQKPIPRRDFLGKAAAGACGAAMGLAGLGMLRLPTPAVLPEEAAKVKVGRVDEIAEGPHWIRQAKAFLLRQKGELFAISAVCTHLGCIVKEGLLENGKKGFICPCHGSIFDADGQVTGGPAPAPLPWLAISIDSGVVSVDASVHVEPGTRVKV